MKMKGSGGFPISLLIASLLFLHLASSMELLSPEIVQAVS
jgi:hypothetical protein